MIYVLCGMVWAADEGLMRATVLAIEGGPWTVTWTNASTTGTFYAQAGAPTNTADGRTWNEYVTTNELKWLSTDVSWVVRVTPNQPVSCDSASPCIRVFESTGSIEPFPTTGSQDHPASYGTAFHQNGSYQITATKGLDTTIGYLSIKNKTLSPKRIETYCYPPGFSWPRYALNEAEEVTWTIAHAPQLSCGKATEGWTTASYTVTYK